MITSGLKIIDIIVFGNFEKDAASVKLQTVLRTLGIQTRHSSNNGKNSSDLELTVNALRDLYKNPNIDFFVTISSDRDIIPLLKEIKYENKIAYLISTKNGFNPTVIKYADYHEYLEDIFKLQPPDNSVANRSVVNYEFDNRDELLEEIGIDPANVGLTKLQRAEEVAGYFYKSHIRAQASLLGKPVNLKGYLDVVAKVVKRSPAEILDDFKLAHCLKYITIYKDPDRGLCVKEGNGKPKLSL